MYIFIFISIVEFHSYLNKIMAQLLNFSLEDSSQMLVEVFNTHSAEIDWASDADVIFQASHLNFFF